MAHHNTTGNTGETLAVAYLVKKGYNILQRNWRHSHWEVDIIASLDKKLHFIEVKTRRTATFGMPEDDVTRKKILNLVNSADEFLILFPEWKLIQFDILSITLAKNKEPEYYFIEDVYL